MPIGKAAGRWHSFRFADDHPIIDLRDGKLSKSYVQTNGRYRSVHFLPRIGRQMLVRISQNVGHAIQLR